MSVESHLRRTRKRICIDLMRLQERLLSVRGEEHELVKSLLHTRIAMLKRIERELSASGDFRQKTPVHGVPVTKAE